MPIVLTDHEPCAVIIPSITGEQAGVLPGTFNTLNGDWLIPVACAGRTELINARQIFRALFGDAEGPPEPGAQIGGMGLLLPPPPPQP